MLHQPSNEVRWPSSTHISLRHGVGECVPVLLIKVLDKFLGVRNLSSTVLQLHLRDSIMEYVVHGAICAAVPIGKRIDVAKWVCERRVYTEGMREMAVPKDHGIINRTRSCAGRRVRI